MKRLAIAGSILLAAAADASAISRYNIGNMSCAKVQSLIQSEGAVILRYQSKRNPGLPLYDRYVADLRYCGFNEVISRTGVPTADRDYCQVRRCIQNELFDLR